MSNFPKSEHRSLRLPPGVKDFLFEEAQRRRDVERGITITLASKGYNEIITPTIEYGEVFSQASKNGQGRNGLDERVYRFLDRDGNLLALRADFTAQIARIAASRFRTTPTPIRVFYSGKVFRAEPHHAGRSREKWQVGFEILGSSDIDSDAEVIHCILDILASLGLLQIKIAVGHIGYFNGIVEHTGLGGDAVQQLKYLIERKDTSGLGRRMDEWQLPESCREALRLLPGLHGGSEVLAQAAAFVKNATAQNAVARLDELLQKIKNHAHAGNVFLDLSEVEGMGYYTGIMIRAFAAGVGQEVGSGGRYDRLVSRFGYDMPAIGFSFDVDLLVDAVQSGL